MENVYIEFDFKVTPVQPGVEILIAELGFAGFESFVETEYGVQAYILKKNWESDLLNEIQILSNDEFSISFHQRDIDEVNWNEEWEKNFKPILVGESCYVRAPFHKSKEVQYDVVIEPKMSFGTGHHETTYMMLKYILELDFTDKIVLDMGCGTSVLAILACKCGAQHADAIDIDKWCYENSMENIQRNKCQNIHAYQGTVNKLEHLSDIKNPKYDCILANINRNILLEDITTYVLHLKNEGELLISGFYTEDLDAIQKVAKEAKLKFVDNKTRNNWVAARFRKIK